MKRKRENKRKIKQNQSIKFMGDISLSIPQKTNIQWQTTSHMKRLNLQSCCPFFQINKANYFKIFNLIS